MSLPPYRSSSGSSRPRAPWVTALAARSPKGKSPSPSSGKPTPAPGAAAKAEKKPAAAKPARPATPAPRPAAKPVEPVKYEDRPRIRRMGRGQKPPIIPVSPPLPPTPPTPPEHKGAAPTMQYGEAPVPPKKRPKGQTPRSTAQRAAEAARAAVWAVSSEKTTAQIEAAEGAFEAALSEHKADAALRHNAPRVEPAAPRDAKGADEGHEAPASAASPRRATKDRFTFFRDELERQSEADDPHEPWRQETGTPRHEMFSPSSEAQLDEVERELKAKLPPSYREFSLNWGGGRLFTQEWRSIRLVGGHDMPREMRDRLCDRMHLPFIPLADLGDGDYLAFDTSKPNVKGEYPVVWWYGGHLKKRVSATFQDWLEQLVASDGEAFWWEEAS